MAQAFPQELPSRAQLRDRGMNDISAAERHMFTLLRDRLDDTFTVFHSVAFQAGRTRGGVVDREVDLLLAHPQHGLLIMEVKGGRVGRLGVTGQWFSWDRNGKRHEIKDPFAQAREATYRLLEELRNHHELRKAWWTPQYAVALPEVSVPGDLQPDAPRAIIFDELDAQPGRIAAAVARVLTHYRQSDVRPPGPAIIRVLTQWLAPNWVLGSRRASQYIAEHEQLLRLTEEQNRLLDLIDHKRRARIAGCAGSGKTMLAVEKARRLAAEGQRVLVTCFNKALAAWLEQTQATEGVTYRHFHSLAHTVPKEIGRSFPDQKSLGVDDEEFWGQVVPNALFDAAVELPDEKKYDALIVDEAQDFRATYWEPLQILLRDPDDGTLYIFYDPSQRIYADDPFPLREDDFRLTKNMRSTYEIGETVSLYYHGDGRMEPGGPKSGRPVHFIRPKGDETPVDALARTLDALVVKGKVKAEDIVLLTRHKESGMWQHDLRVGDYTLVRTARKRRPNDIETATIYAFKGLERPVVILAELEELSGPEGDRLIYVGLSRARNDVFVLGALPAGSVSR